MTTTTDEMTHLLSTKADELTAAATAAEDEYAALRVKVQESAWALGWQNSIGSVMEEMLEELGLQGRPTRTDGQAKVRLTVGLRHGVGDHYVGSLAGNGIQTGLPMVVAQERSLRAPNIHLPTGTILEDGCYCQSLDEDADWEEVAKAIREYNDWTDVQVEVLALRCSGHACRNMPRTI